MQANTESRTHIDHLVHLPSFAQYLLDHKLNELVSLQLQISREIDLPLLKQLSSLSSGELTELSRNSMKELLGYLSRNEVEEYIKISLDRYIKNQLPFIASKEIAA